MSDQQVLLLKQEISIYCEFGIEELERILNSLSDYRCSTNIEVLRNVLCKIKDSVQKEFRSIKIIIDV